MTAENLRKSYLELMKKILLNEIYFEHESSLYGPQEDEAARWAARQIGRETPQFALTMVGRRRLDNVHHCVTTALENGIPGDLMECGVCRGGVAILMRAILHAYGISDRNVWVADSFQGVPAPKADLYPADAGHVLHERKDLAVSMAEVRKNFARFDLLDEQVKFIAGFFTDSLPQAPVGQLAVLRLDGDLYESTYVCLVNLYDRVSPGGFVIVDDYNCYECCRLAVQDFARERGLTFDIRDIDGWGAYWRKDGPSEVRAQGTEISQTAPGPDALFDSAYYLGTYPDVAAAGVDPYRHYFDTGFLEGRDPHPLFDTSYYLESYPDVAARGRNPLLDYWECGAAQGRNPHPLFDTAYYAEQAQIAGGGENALLHYCTSGFRAGWSPHPLFDVQMVLKQRPEEAPARSVNPLVDFLSRHGARTPRPHMLFDPVYYLDRYPDVATAPINAFLHYLMYGWREGRNPHSLFDSAFYRSQQDMNSKGVCPLIHYVLEGWRLGLNPHPWFDGDFYLRQHPEVAAAGESALAHYLRLGYRLNYDPNDFVDTKAYLEKHGDHVPAGMSPLQYAVERGGCDEVADLLRESLENGQDGRSSHANQVALGHAYLRGDEVSDGLPVFLTIESTSICNLKCIMCPYPTMGRKNEHMEMSVYEKIIAEGRGHVEFIWLQVFGEPLLNPNIYTMIEMAADAGITVGIATNITPLTERASRALLDSRLSLLILSFDGATKATYETIRKGANFERVSENIRRFAEMKSHSASQLKAVLQMITMDLNTAEQKQFQEDWLLPGLDAVFIKSYHAWANQDVSYVNIGPKQQPTQFGLCREPWLGMVVLADGRVSPCCNDYSGHTILGDLKTQSLKEVWNGLEMRKLRRMLANPLSDRTGTICHKCPFSVTSFADAKLGLDFFNPAEENLATYVTNRRGDHSWHVRLTGDGMSKH